MPITTIVMRLGGNHDEDDSQGKRIKTPLTGAVVVWLSWQSGRLRNQKSEVRIHSFCT